MPKILHEIEGGVQIPHPKALDQIPHPLEDFDDQIPSSPGRQRCQMPGVCPGGGGMLKLRFDRYITTELKHFDVCIYYAQYVNLELF